MLNSAGSLNIVEVHKFMCRYVEFCRFIGYLEIHKFWSSCSYFLLCMFSAIPNTLIIIMVKLLVTFFIGFAS